MRRTDRLRGPMLLGGWAGGWREERRVALLRPLPLPPSPDLGGRGTHLASAAEPRMPGISGYSKRRRGENSTDTKQRRGREGYRGDDCREAEEGSGKRRTQ